MYIHTQFFAYVFSTKAILVPCKLHVHRAKHTINEISANETSKQRYRSAGVFNRWFTTSRSFLIERFHDWRSKRCTNDRRELPAKLFTTDTSDTRDSNRSTTDRHSFSRVLHYLCAVVFNHDWTYNISARHFK